jgi:Asp-tRNA(Asn)/Glu-tRNA(Gln) amidotransferase A subunit family amidase
MEALRVTTDAPEDLSREAFEQALKSGRLTLSPDERESVYRLASWMHEGIAALGDITSEGAAAPTSGEARENPADLTIAEAGRRIRAGSLTSESLVVATLERIAARNPRFRAFHAVLEDGALEAARQADDDLAAGHDRGPLHGIPVGIKDLIDVAGAPTTANSRRRANHVASADAEVVRRLREAGAVITGKLATYEYGTVGPADDSLFEPALNPWNAERITGGSSSGGASALAAGMLRTTIGSDTGGSLRGPASYCGVVGLKPTHGLVPDGGAIGLAPSMDHLGPMSASVAEAALTLDAITGRTGAESTAALLGRDLVGLRIGYARNWFARDPQAAPAIVAAMDDAVSQLSLLGAAIEEIEMPRYEAFEAAGAAILHYESFVMHREALAEHPEDFGRKTYQTLAAGAALTPADYSQAQRAGRALRVMLDREVFARVDALVTACTLTTALPVSMFGQQAAWTPMRTIGFNVTGHPAVALPIGITEGMPMGMQIAGRHLDEARLCQIGDAFERATGHCDARPPSLD